MIEGLVVGLVVSPVKGLIDSGTFAPGGGGDVTPPVLSSPEIDPQTVSTADISATTDEGNGTIYFYVSASAVPPTVANLKSGAGAVYAGNQAVVSAGQQTIGATGLSMPSDYYMHVLHTDSSANDSSILTSAKWGQYAFNMDGTVQRNMDGTPQELMSA